jgi:hypothetical protein
MHKYSVVCCKCANVVLIGFHDVLKIKCVHADIVNCPCKIVNAERVVSASEVTVTQTEGVT